MFECSGADTQRTTVRSLTSGARDHTHSTESLSLSALRHMHCLQPSAHTRAQTQTQAQHSLRRFDGDSAGEHHPACQAKCPLSCRLHHYLCHQWAAQTAKHRALTSGKRLPTALTRDAHYCTCTTSPSVASLHFDTELDTREADTHVQQAINPTNKLQRMYAESQSVLQRAQARKRDCSMLETKGAAVQALSVKHHFGDVLASLDNVSAVCQVCDSVLHCIKFPNLI